MNPRSFLDLAYEDDDDNVDQEPGSLEDERPVEVVDRGNREVGDENRNLTLMMSAAPLLRALNSGKDIRLENVHERSEEKLFEDLHDEAPLLAGEDRNASLPIPRGKMRKVRNREKRRKKGRKRKNRKKSMRGGQDRRGRTLLFQRYQAKRRRQLRQRRRLEGKNILVGGAAGPSSGSRRKHLQRNGRRQLGRGKLRQLWTQSQKYQAWRRHQSREQLLAQPAAQMAIEQMWQGLFRQGAHWKQVYQVTKNTATF